MELVQWFEDNRLFDFASCRKAIDQYHPFTSQPISDDHQRFLECRRELVALSAAELALLPHRTMPEAFVFGAPVSVSGSHARQAVVAFDCDIYDWKHSERERSHLTLADLVVFGGDAVKLDIAARDRGLAVNDLDEIYENLLDLVAALEPRYMNSIFGRRIWESGLIRFESVIWKAKLARLLDASEATVQLETYANVILDSVSG